PALGRRVDRLHLGLREAAAPEPQRDVEAAVVGGGQLGERLWVLLLLVGGLLHLRRRQVLGDLVAERAGGVPARGEHRVTARRRHDDVLGVRGQARDDPRPAAGDVIVVGVDEVLLRVCRVERALVERQEPVVVLLADELVVAARLGRELERVVADRERLLAQADTAGPHERALVVAPLVRPLHRRGRCGRTRCQEQEDQAADEKTSVTDGLVHLSLLRTDARRRAGTAERLAAPGRWSGRGVDHHRGWARRR